MEAGHSPNCAPRMVAWLMLALRSRSSLLSSLVAFGSLLCAPSLLAGCGGNASANVVKVPIADGTRRPVVPTGPDAPQVQKERPAQVAAWLHVGNALGWMTLLGMNQQKAPGEDTMKAALEVLAAFDLTRAADVAMSMDKGEEVEVAASLPIHDRERFLDLVREKVTIEERKSRYYLKMKGSDDGSAASGKDRPKAGSKKKSKEFFEKEIVCEFTTAPAQAICGTERGVSEYGPWLRSSPAPARGNVSLELYAAPVRELALGWLRKEDQTDDGGPKDPNAPQDPDAAEAARKSREDKAKWNEGAAMFVNDLEQISLTAEIRGKELESSLSTQFRSLESPWLKTMFVPVAAKGQPELLSRLSQQASAALYSQGGGPLSELLSTMDLWDNLPDADRAQAKATSQEIQKLLGKPFGAAYGVELDRVRASLATFRKAKDPEKAQKALAEAIDGYGAFAFETDVASMQKLMREASRLNDVERQRKAASTGVASSSSKLTFRMASPALGLPAGSFFADETKTVEEDVKAPKGTTTTKKKKKKTTTKAETLCVGDGQFTYTIIGLDDERAFVAVAKDLLARKTESLVADPFFQRPGLLLGGQITSLVGAFGVHEMALKMTPKMSEEERVKLADDLDKDLAGAKLVIPFALTADKRGAGGVLAFNVKGDSAAFIGVGEHMAESLAGLFMLPLLMSMTHVTP
jgi:hypothetical protein